MRGSSWILIFHKVRAEDDSLNSLKKELEELRLTASKTEFQRDEAWLGLWSSSTRSMKRSRRTGHFENYEHNQQKAAEVRQQEREEYRLVA